MCAPIVIIWVLAQATAHTVGRSRRPAPASDEVDLMPQPWLAEPRLRWLAYASLTAWILLTLMPIVTIAMSAAGQRAEADSSRLAVSTTTGLAASNLQASLASNQVMAITISPSPRTPPDGGAGNPKTRRKGRLGEAEVAAADRWLAVTEPMTRMPTTEDGVDEALVEALSRDHPGARSVTSRPATPRRIERHTWETLSIWPPSQSRSPPYPRVRWHSP